MLRPGDLYPSRHLKPPRFWTHVSPGSPDPQLRIGIRRLTVGILLPVVPRFCQHRQPTTGIAPRRINGVPQSSVLNQAKLIRPLFLVLLPLQLAQAQGTVPTFQHTTNQQTYTLVGAGPTQGTTTIPVVLARLSHF
jgi:hypothetical protein